MRFEQGNYAGYEALRAIVFPGTCHKLNRWLSRGSRQWQVRPSSVVTDIVRKGTGSNTDIPCLRRATLTPPWITYKHSFDGEVAAIS